VTRDNTPRLVLNGVAFDGAVAVAQERLTAAWRRYRGKPVGLGDLRAIGRNAEAIYAKAGYPFVAVVLKAQDVRDGVVHFNVVEGRISDLTILGSNPTARRQATALLQPLVGRHPLSVADVETAYELAQKVPDLSIDGALRRGSQPGGMDLVVAARRGDPWRAYLNVNDLYADTVGPWGVLAGVDYFGSATHGDQGSAQIYTSVPFGRQLLLRGSYSIGLNGSGTTLAVSGLLGNANPKGALAALALATDIATLRVDLSQPIVERRQASLVADISLEGSNQRTKVFSRVGLSDDKLRDLDASLSGEQTNAIGRWAGTLELRQGLDFAGASHRGDPLLSRIDGDPDATIWKFSGEAQSNVVEHVSLAARVEAQYSSHPLTAPDQYTPGNLSIGRGYQPGVALGDSAAAGSLELRVGPFPLNRILQVQPFIFADGVRLYNHPVAPFAERTLRSTGGGVRCEISGKMHIDLIFADPLDAPGGFGARQPPAIFLLNMTVNANDAFAAIHQRLARGAEK
jgi:hemolysin activation/secretion protein